MRRAEMNKTEKNAQKKKSQQNHKLFFWKRLIKLVLLVTHQKRTKEYKILPKSGMKKRTSL